MPGADNLLGRQPEMQRLRQMLTDGTEPSLVVSGEPGVGKTALVEEFCLHATAADWLVVRVMGVAAEETFALGGLNQLVLALGEYRGGLDAKDRAVLAPVSGGEPDSAVEAFPLTMAVLGLLARAAQVQPVLVVVDDVQWLDSVSARVLGAVGRRLGRSGIRVVATRRTACDSDFSSSGWGEVALAPLGAEDSQRLLEHSEVALTATAKSAILAAAEGNPLALVELPRGADRIDDVIGSLPLTERLLAVFGERLEQLDTQVRGDLLRAALDGIAGGGLTGAARARYVIRTAQAALGAGLLTVDPLGEIVFRHPLVRAAVIHQADPEERRNAHRDLAGLYRDVPVRRAPHLAAAAVEPDQEVADVLAGAAKQSIRRGGLAVGVQWLRRAAELCTDDERREALIADAVFVAARSGYPDGTEILLETDATAHTDSPLAVLADAYRSFHADGEVISTHRRVLDALGAAEDLDDRTVNRLAYLLVSITNYADSAGYRERTAAALLPLADRLDPAVLMYRTGAGDIAETVQAVRAMLQDSVDSLAHVPAQRMVLLSFPAYCAGSMAEFRAPLQTAFAQLCKHGPSTDAIDSGRVLILDLVASGNWPQAEQVGAACLEMAGQLEGTGLRRHQLLADLGALAAGRGDVQTADRCAADVRAWSKPRGLQRLLDAADRIAVRTALAEADYDAAYNAWVRISPPAQWPLHNFHEVAEDMLDAVEAALHSGHLTDARALAAEAVRWNLPVISQRVAALTVAITAMTAPDTEAGDLYRSALSQPGLADFPFDHARVLLAQGMWLRRARRHTEARSALESAAEGFDRLGARPWAERARAELRAAGASTKRSLGQAHPLSAQQRRIAELAAAGSTSKEIAAQLSLSPRTVDSHLYRVFRSLGITRRAGLGEALRRYDAEHGSDAATPAVGSAPRRRRI